jgi:predicted PurR-regulated permease PerM
MATPVKSIPSAHSLATLANVVLAAFIICTLYFGRELLVPLALAALLTFMLAPLVTRCQRWLGRVGAVLLVVGIMFSATLAGGWILTRQAVDVATKLPNYKENIRTKLRSIRVPDKGPFSQLSQTFEELKKDLPGAVAEKASGEPSRPPMPVEVVNGPDKRLEFVQLVLAPVLGPLGTSALVILLVIFMLLEREDLRNRIIRLIGQGRISATSRAMDDAGIRVSRYLRMLLVVNMTYGLAVALGLYFIGLPNALLWGALATVLRFIPYVGPWIAAALPIILSFAVSDGWMTPVLVIGLYLLMELISNNVMEPWLYGSSTGVTPIALIVAALVWTWLWGPVGLVLATPLTVCLVVMGRHIPRLAFLSIVLSDEEPLTPAEDCYHRLHRAGEHDEIELVDTFLKTHPADTLIDTVLVPVIIAAESDHRAGLLAGNQLDFIEKGMVGILEELELRQEGLAIEAVLDSDADFSICCVPARAWRDEIVGSMLAIHLREAGHLLKNASAKMMTGELVEWVREENPSIICVSAVHPTSVTHARYLCIKLRAALPKAKIVVGMWGHAGNVAEDFRVLRDAGATEVFNTVREAAQWIRQAAPMTLIEEPAA